jgi:hypothetical protein
VAPSYPALRPLGFVLWGYIKDQVYSFIVIILEELKARTTVAPADITKDMLQRVCQQVDLRWDVRRARHGTHCKLFPT